jgi:hypothetical protein
MATNARPPRKFSESFGTIGSFCVVRVVKSILSIFWLTPLFILRPRLIDILLIAYRIRIKPMEFQSSEASSMILAFWPLTLERRE